MTKIYILKSTQLYFLYISYHPYYYKFKYMNQQNKNCSLHQQPFEYFCQKCYEPVCRQCTIIGPHNTPIHSISNLAAAYEQRVNEIKERISAFLENKSSIIESIETLNMEIQQLKQLKDVSVNENERYKSRMLQDLQKHEERIRNEIGLIKEEFQSKVNSINDLGHTFQTTTDDIQIITSHTDILQSIKECMDRLNIMLENNYTFTELPKQLSDLRLDLKNIEAFKEMIDQKVKLIKQVFDLLEAQKAKIQKPQIDFDKLFKQLSNNIQSCIQHNVCHFCGAIFSFQIVNTPCKINNTALDINQYVGFCQKKPDSVRWATYRHCFAQPADKYANFRTEGVNSYSIHLQALLVKLRTITILKKINLKRIFMQTDKAQSGSCKKIQMMYILMQVCGLSSHQSEIILTLCNQPTKNIYVYGPILQKLKEIDIDPSQMKLDEEFNMMKDLLDHF